MLVYQSYDDHQLLQLLKAGDTSALEEIYKRYQALLFSHAYKRLDNKEEARDLVQDLFLYLWTHRNDLNITSNFSAYLYASVRNRILNIYRNKSVRNKHIQSLQGFIEKGQSITEEEIRHKELVKLVEKEVAQLPPKMRLVFELSRNLQLSHQQIADELHVSPHTVRTQIKNVLRILRNKLDDRTFFYIIHTLLMLAACLIIK